MMKSVEIDEEGAFQIDRGACTLNMASARWREDDTSDEARKLAVPDPDAFYSIWAAGRLVAVCPIADGVPAHMSADPKWLA